MHNAMIMENNFPVQPVSLEKHSIVIDNAKLSCIEKERDANENRHRLWGHYESLSLEEPGERAASSALVVHPSNTSLQLKTALDRRMLLMKSTSLPNSENIVGDPPDPFPELSQQLIAPVSARMYGTETSSSSLPNSPEKHADRTGGRITSAAPASISRGSSDRTVSGDINSHALQNKMTVDVYVNEQKFHSVDVDNSTTVANVCDHLIQITHSKRDPFWTIVEHVDKFSIERNLEDHELLVPILKSWHSAKNRLLFRRDFYRYELYSNPHQYFPEQMLDIKLPKEDTMSFMTRSECYRNLLLKCLLANQSLPDIQGYLHIRDGRKGWKRYLCVLQPSGLYCITKGCTKDSLHTVLISGLTDDNIYTALNSKKMFGAPTQHCFCLAPSHDLNDKNKLRLFCTEDEQSRLCWTTGMRFIKFGDQLHENCRSFVACTTSLKEKSETERINGCISKICDKVILNPVIKVPNQEYQENNTNSISRINDPLTANTLTSVKSISSDSNPRNLEWFHDSIDRDEAVYLLSNDGLKEGTFLVRYSQTLSGVYVLSFVHGCTVKHCTIHKIKLDDNCYFSLDGGFTKFLDLIQLIDFYRLNAGRLPTRLIRHVTHSQ